MSNPLSYNITDWHQLSKGVKSNTSDKLSIKIADLTQNDEITGLRLSVCHEKFGILFSYVIDAQGSIVTEINDNLVYELSTNQILSELKKYGFNITYDEKANLPSDQLDFLKELLSLGFDKLRILGVWKLVNGVKQYKHYLIVFNVKQNPAWITNTYVASFSEFTEALRNGSCVNVSATGKANRWSWNWLDFVANIQDILDENGVVV